jgi:hypothetical protein
LSSELEPPWKEKQKPRHQRQEQDLQKRGGISHPASGRIWRFRRDGKLFDFLIEARTTESGRYCISADEWESVRKEAHMTPPGLMPGMQIDIGDTRLMVIELVVFEEIYNQLVSMTAVLGRE